MKTLREFVDQFTRPMRTRPNYLILDEMKGEPFYLVFDFEECPEFPDTVDTCDVLLIPLFAEDPLAAAIRIAADCDLHRLTSLLEAIGFDRMPEKVRIIFAKLD